MVLLLLCVLLAGRTVGDDTVAPTVSPTVFPTVVPTEAQTEVPTLAPSTLCNSTVCLIESGGDVVADPDCCGRRTTASCTSGFSYSVGSPCGTEDYETCCQLTQESSSSDSDGLTVGEELAIGLLFGIFGAVVLFCCLRGTFYFAMSGFKYPDGLGAVGSTTYYDERRGQCFGLIIVLTIFSFATLVVAYLAASDDAEALEAFGFARVQTSKTSTYLVIGLTGYVVKSSETNGLTFFAFDDDYGKDS